MQDKAKKKKNLTNRGLLFMFTYSVENPHGQRSLEGYSPRGLKELAQLSHKAHIRCHRAEMWNWSPRGENPDNSLQIPVTNKMN